VQGELRRLQVHAAVGDLQVPQRSPHARQDEGVATIEAVDAHSPEARALVQTYLDEIGVMFPDGLDPARSVTAEPYELSPPRGTFLVVRDDDGTAIGCGGLKMLDPQTAEVKRIWLAPAARGRGLGAALLEALEHAARALGAIEGRLDTNAKFESALALFHGHGWREVPPYNSNAYATHWFAKSL
jgi:GNAT superfamily N-acetyltransferase